MVSPASSPPSANLSTARTSAGRCILHPTMRETTTPSRSRVEYAASLTPLANWRSSRDSSGKAPHGKDVPISLTAFPRKTGGTEDRSDPFGGRKLPYVEVPVREYQRAPYMDRKPGGQHLCARHIRHRSIFSTSCHCRKGRGRCDQFWASRSEASAFSRYGHTTA